MRKRCYTMYPIQFIDVLSRALQVVGCICVVTASRPVKAFCPLWDRWHSLREYGRTLTGNIRLGQRFLVISCMSFELSWWPAKKITVTGDPVVGWQQTSPSGDGRGAGLCLIYNAVAY